MIHLELSEVGLQDLFKGVFFPLLLVFGLELLYRDVLVDFSRESVPEM